jgi:hypothetical protein
MGKSPLLTEERTDEIEDGVASNGSAPVAMQPPSSPGVKIPRDFKWVRMPERYGDAGLKIRLWVNARSSLVDDALMAASPTVPTYADLERQARALDEREKNGEDVEDELRAIDEETASRLQTYRAGVEEAKARRLKALHLLVTEHNGWVDYEDRPLPLASDDTFWQEIPDDLAAAIMITLRREAAKLPSSMMRTGRR